MVCTGQKKTFLQRKASDKLKFSVKLECAFESEQAALPD